MAERHSLRAPSASASVASVFADKGVISIRRNRTCVNQPKASFLYISFKQDFERRRFYSMHNAGFGVLCGSLC
jgi:hypothetical protein